MKTVLTLFIFDKIGDVIVKSLRTLMITVCELIYSLIVFCFDVFEELGTAKIITDTEINEIFNKVSLILGIFMVFRLTFAAIQYIVDPDLMTDKNKGAGNIIKKIIISVVLLGSVNYMFKMAYELQNTINEDKVFERILLGKGDPEYEKEPGQRVANELFLTFFNLSPNFSSSGQDENDYEYGTIKNTVGYDFSPLYRQINETFSYEDETTKTEKEEFVYKLEGGGLGSLLVGAAGLYIIFAFTIQVAVRLFQLAYLQIVAPIPIMMYITPKGEEYLKKWCQQCLTTFLDFFIRTGIIYFSIYLIGIITKNIDTISLPILEKSNIGTKAYVTGILIIGVLIFAKKLPSLLKEIFPSLGGAAGFSYSMKLPSELKTIKGAATFGAGAIIGGAAGMATGIANGKGTLTGRAGNAFTGFFRGVAGGAKTKGSIVENVKKGMASQRVASQKAYERNNDGSTFWGRTLGASGASRTKEAFDKELSLYSDYNGVVDLIDKELEKDGTVQAAMASKQALIDRASNGGPLPTAAEITAADEAIKTAKKASLKREIDTGANKKIASALSNAEAIRAKGQEKGYAGFGKQSISSGTAEARADAYFDNKDKTGIETNEIKGAGGSRNAAYKQAEANAKYNKTK